MTGDTGIVWETVVLLLATNGAPVLVARAMGERWAAPVDCGALAPDGRPWLGGSKTWRGLLTALVVGAAVGGAVGAGVMLGIAVAALSMLGDLLSSLVKRRMGIPASGQAVGLDQVPEALIPAAALAHPLELTPVEVVTVTLAFAILDMVLSVAGYWVGVRKRPY